MTSFRATLGQSWNSEILAILPYEIGFFSEFQIYEIFKKVLSYLELEGQGRGIIMGVTRAILLCRSILLCTCAMYLATHWHETFPPSAYVTLLNKRQITAVNCECKSKKSVFIVLGIYNFVIKSKEADRQLFCAYIHCITQYYA